MKIELTAEELKQLIKITPVGATTDVNLKIGAKKISKIIQQKQQNLENQQKS